MDDTGVAAFRYHYDKTQQKGLVNFSAPIIHFSPVTLKEDW
jgi:hypothetical protein